MAIGASRQPMETDVQHIIKTFAFSALALLLLVFVVGAKYLAYRQGWLSSDDLGPAGIIIWVCLTAVLLTALKKFQHPEDR